MNFRVESCRVDQIGRSVAGVGSFASIHCAFVSGTSEVIIDGRWIVGAEHGPRNVKYYYLRTEALGRQFVEKGSFRPILAC